MFCSIYAFQTDCSAHGTYCIVHSFHRVQPSVCSLYEFHTEYTAVCPSFTLGALKAVGVPHWVYCCMSLFTLAILHIFTLWKPYVFTLSVLQSVRILFALSYFVHSECTAVRPCFKSAAICTCFTLGALQSVRGSHRAYCSLSVISLGVLCVFTLWCIESRTCSTPSVLQSVRILFTLNVSHTECTAVCTCFTQSVLQPVRYFTWCAPCLHTLVYWKPCVSHT